MQSSNGQSQDNRLLSPRGSQARFTAERVLRTRPKTYRKIVHLLADPCWSVLQISKACRVSEHTVRAIRERESVTIAERKQRLLSIFGNVAETSAERMEELCGKASLRDAGVSAGIATDKFIALLGGNQAHVAVQINFQEENEQAQVLWRALRARQAAERSGQT